MDENGAAVTKALAEELVGIRYNNTLNMLAANQTQRSISKLCAGIKHLSNAFPKKRIHFRGANEYGLVANYFDRNEIVIHVFSAPGIDGVSPFAVGAIPDNFLDDGKFVSGRSVLSINGNLVALAKGQRHSFVKVRATIGVKEFIDPKFEIKDDNGLLIGFAVYNQIFTFFNVFLSNSNAGDIMEYILRKAADVLDFGIFKSLTVEEAAKKVLAIRMRGIKKEIELLKNTVQNSEASQKIYLEKYLNEVRLKETNDETLKILLEATRDEAAAVDRFSKEINGLLEEKKYVEFFVDFSNNGNPLLCAVSNRIYITHNDRVYDFGYYTVKIGVGNGLLNHEQIGFDNTGVNYNGFVHPHAAACKNDLAGKVCWGALAADVAQKCGKSDIVGLLSICYYFLCSYSDRQPNAKIELFGIPGIPLKNFKPKNNTIDDYLAYTSEGASV